MNRLILALVLLALPTPSLARFIGLDAQFDFKPLGQPLDRRGAEFGEPVPGLHDHNSDEVVFDGAGDRSVRVSDTSSFGGDADLLYFTFADSRSYTDGKVTISCEIEPELQDNYLFSVTSTDELSRHFSLDLDGAGFLYWSDENDLAVTNFGSYTVGAPMLIELRFDLEAGTYDFDLDGVNILTDEVSGTLGSDLSLIRVGNDFDGNNVGSVRIDNPQVDFAPGTATVLLSANFNNKAPGLEIGTGGAELGEPVSTWGSPLPTVMPAGAPFPSRSLQIEDNSATEGAGATFHTVDELAMTQGSVCVSFRAAFDQLEDYRVHVGAPNVGDAVWLTFTAGGAINIAQGVAPQTTIASGTYAAAIPVTVELALELDYDLFSVWIDGERIVHREAIPAVAGIGRVTFRMLTDADLNGRMRIDAVNMYHSGSATPAPLPARAQAAQLVGMVPNPFNPSTEIHFELTSPGSVELAIFDSRGRRVRSFAREALPAGAYSRGWHGLDDTGRLVASGVYHARLTVDGMTQARAMTLVK